MGQFRAKGYCPLCQVPGNAKWTCPQCTDLVGVYRGLIRNLQAWRSAYESGDISLVITSPLDGQEYCLWDVERFYSYRDRLPKQMRLAITLCLYENLAEKVVAVQLGLSATTPVSIYATVGLTQLLAQAKQGELPSFAPELEVSV